MAETTTNPRQPRQVALADTPSFAFGAEPSPSWPGEAWRSAGPVAGTVEGVMMNAEINAQLKGITLCSDPPEYTQTEPV
jgi:hypothetical protein